MLDGGRAGDEARPRDDELETIELQLLTEAVFRRYGLDFRNYAAASLRRRVQLAMNEEGVRTISALTDRLLHDPPAMERLLLRLSINVTAMFRDPGFFLSLRHEVIPHLRSYPFVRIWHAGCSTGEEVYSTAILLQEEGIYDRCRIYATDFNEAALRRARDGIVPLDMMQEYSTNYLRAGGHGSLSDYYTANYGHAIFRQSLRKNVIFSQHNLVTDGSFNEFNLILCRNVMIYFNEQLQNRVHKLLYASLRRYGVLGLGRKESLRGTPHEEGYEIIDENERIFRRPR
ncbi:MAG TPA: protein-glutamate O-methyltransferase CheR [Polyangia bacterium]|nr:protein-glutamate O-methyltransferase CheR [Polyangia bacterium]